MTMVLVKSLINAPSKGPLTQARQLLDWQAHMKAVVGTEGLSRGNEEENRYVELHLILVQYLGIPKRSGGIIQDTDTQQPWEEAGQIGSQQNRETRSIRCWKPAKGKQGKGRTCVGRKRESTGGQVWVQAKRKMAREFGGCTQLRRWRERWRYEDAEEGG